MEKLYLDNYYKLDCENKLDYYSLLFKNGLENIEMQNSSALALQSGTEAFSNQGNDDYQKKISLIPSGTNEGKEIIKLIVFSGIEN